MVPRKLRAWHCIYATNTHCNLLDVRHRACHQIYKGWLSHGACCGWTCRLGQLNIQINNDNTVWYMLKKGFRQNYIWYQRKGQRKYNLQHGSWWINKHFLSGPGGEWQFHQCDIIVLGLLTSRFRYYSTGNGEPMKCYQHGEIWSDQEFRKHMIQYGMEDRLETVRHVGNYFLRSVWSTGKFSFSVNTDTHPYIYIYTQLHTRAKITQQCSPAALAHKSSTYLDLLRLASAAAAWSSWVDLLAGTPKTALWVTSLRIRLCPARWALGDDGGVRDPSFCPWMVGGGVVWTFGCCLMGAWIC